MASSFKMLVSFYRIDRLLLLLLLLSTSFDLNFFLMMQCWHAEEISIEIEDRHA